MKLYEDLAGWWPLFSPPSDYAEEAGVVRGFFDALPSPPRTLLELGCGGGHLACHLKQHYRLTLSDLARGMLACSEALNPECEHIAGDMRTLRLGRTFDAVLIHDAIMYMTTEDDLRAALTTAFLHARPGGVVLVMPDCVRETFEPHTDTGGSDEAGRSIRFLEWASDPDPTDRTFRMDYVVALREGDGPLRVEHDTHLEGLFSRADWLRLFGEAGLVPRIVSDPWRQDLFLASRPT